MPHDSIPLIGPHICQVSRGNMPKKTKQLRNVFLCISIPRLYINSTLLSSPTTQKINIKYIWQLSLIEIVPPKIQTACESVTREGKYEWESSKMILTMVLWFWSTFLASYPCEGLAIQEQVYQMGSAPQSNNMEMDPRPPLYTHILLHI